MKFYAVALFEAHCTTAPGRRPRSDRPLAARSSGELGWIDLVALPASSSPSRSRRRATQRDNRIRQVKSAIRSLAGDDIRLILQPNAESMSRKYQDLVLLDESSSSARPNDIPYTVPRSSGQTLEVESSFYLAGWHYVLTDLELISWLAVQALQATSGTKLHVDMTGDERIRVFGLSKDTYDAFNNLKAFGLMDIERPAGRRPDGTFEGLSDGDLPMPDSYRAVQPPDDSPAIDVVSNVLTRQLSGSG